MKHLAQKKQRGVGKLISSLALSGLSRSARNSKTERSGIPLLPRRKGAQAVTLELVNQLRDEQP